VDYLESWKSYDVIVYIGFFTLNRSDGDDFFPVFTTSTY